MVKPIGYVRTVITTLICLKKEGDVPAAIINTNIPSV